MFGVFTIDESHFGICNNHFHRLEYRDHSQKLLSLLLLVSNASPPQTTAPRAEHFRTMDHFLTDTVPYFTISVSFILCDPEQSFILLYWSRLVVSSFCILKIPGHKQKQSLFCPSCLLQPAQSRLILEQPEGHTLVVAAAAASDDSGNWSRPYMLFRDILLSLKKTMI